MRILSLTVVLCLALVNGTPYNNCGSSSDVLQTVEVSGCGQESVCGIKRGQEASITISFIPDRRLDKVFVELFGIIRGIAFPFPGSSSIADGCRNSTLPCPLDAGETYSYNKTMVVNPRFPMLRVVIKFVLKDENNEPFVCVEIPSKLQ